MGRVKCPHCRQDTLLPPGGVSRLQGAFHIHNLFDIQDTLKKVRSSDHCSKHQEKDADLYCEQCDLLICSHCLVSDHRNHKYDLVSKLFAKVERMITDCLKPLGKQIALLEGAVQTVKTRCTAVTKQKRAVVAGIRTAVAHLRQALDARETELVGIAKQLAQQKLDTLAAQRDRFELQLGQLRSCMDFVKERQRTCSQGEILRMKTLLVKPVNDLAGSFKPQTLALAEHADMKFIQSPLELVKTCQQFGEVYCHPVCPKKCRANTSCKLATRKEPVVVSVEALDLEGKPCLEYVDRLRCELVATDGSSRVRGTVEGRNKNIYNISYQPQVLGKHQLHILIDEHPILDSPFTVTVLPDFTAPANIIGDLKGPWGIAIREGGEVVVAEYDGDCISTISGNGEKKSLGTYGSGPGQFLSPQGVTIDNGGKLIVSEYIGNRIQQFGNHIKTFGTLGTGPLQFQCPAGIAFHPGTGKVYVADNENHRIQVLNSDLTYLSTFGREGSNDGEFSNPFDIATDGVGNVYVADRYNHRIQVFTVDGVYLRQFGKVGGGNMPASQCCY